MRSAAASGFLALVFLLTFGCSGSENDRERSVARMSTPPSAAKEPAAKASAPTFHSEEVAVIKVRDYGTIRFEFLEDVAPGHAENFKKLANQKFYDGTTFHRVIPGFMIQGGDPNSKDRDPRNDGRGDPGYKIKAEFNDTPHTRGIVSMARSTNPDSAGSQFFIVHQDSSHLDGQYTAFARVIEGMDVVDEITEVERDQYGRNGPRDRPMKDVVMESVTIEKRN